MKNRSPTRTARDEAATVVDFNVHGLIGIRLVNPAKGDVKVVERHLGLVPAEFPGNPAVTIKFVEQLEIHQPQRFVGRDDVAFTDDAFIILRSRNLARARTILAMDRIGDNIELTCETGLPAVPLLRQLINLAMLANGIVPVHAAAFEHGGRGVLVTGWSHGSKTGTLLAFMAEGAKFIGDEWIYLSAGRMFGLPDQLEARPWYLRDLPKYRSQVNTIDRLRTGLAAGAAGLLAPLVDRSERGNTVPRRLIRYARQALLDQQSIHLNPKSLFSADYCPLESSLDTVIVAISHDSNDVIMKQIGEDHAVGQMTASFLHEHAGLMSYYQKQLFAFPDRRNELIDRIESHYRSHASEALAGRLICSMYHPYPISPGQLHGAVESLLYPEHRYR